MKHIQTKIILCAMFAISPFSLGAQTVAENETDSLSGAKEPLVQVAYRKVAQSDLLGGVSVVNMEELTKKNYNTYSLDNMQGYIGGWNGNSLWGMDADNNTGYLVMVDGIPRDANNVQPTEIEQITFLKGAQAVVLYGSRAAKGAILITTKRGKEERLSLSIRANTGFHVAKSYPEYLGSAEYMTLYNEALRNDNIAELYSQETIYNYGSGLNPYRYPNVDFYSSDYIRKAVNRSDVTAEITGGGRRARFYSNIGYYRSGDFFTFGEAKDNNISRLNIRGNVDVTITNTISAYINANATFYDSKTARSEKSYWENASTLRPNRLTPLTPLSYLDPNALSALDLVGTSSHIIDGKYFLSGTQIDPTNVFADYYAAGSSKWTSRQFQFDTGVDVDLNKTLKGLSFHTKFAVDYATSYTTAYENTYAVFQPTWSNYSGQDGIVGLQQWNEDKKSGSQNIAGSADKQTIAFSGQFNYENTFNDDHHLSSMLIASGYQQTVSSEYHKISNANLALQLGYNFQNKYYADFGAALIHSAKLAEGHRQALSPSLTLGWRLSKESFLADSPVVDDLIFSVSGSALNQDIDIASFYMYAPTWTQQDGWGWYDGSGEKYTISKRGENKDLTFIKRKELSANLRTSLWNKLITADVSFFVNSMEGYPIQSAILFPNYLSTGYPDASFVPYMNYNNNKRTGFDFNVNFNKRMGEVDFTLGVAGTYYDTKATQRSEVNESAYQNREGKPIDGIWGLQSAGLFQSDAEVAASPEQTFGGTVKAGDIKYVDQNGDNIIDSQDEIYLGKGGWYGAPFTLGINLTAKWKGFTFFAMGTGNFGAYGMKNSTYCWVYGDSKYSTVVRDRWTEETKATATYPRLTTLSGVNNFRSSDFWLYKTDRFNLAKVQVTYDFPKRMFRSSFIQDFSVYASGANLLTISKERKHMEMSVGSAPQTRFYNIGVKAVF